MIQPRPKRFDARRLGIHPFLAEIYASRVDDAREIDLHWRLLLPPTLGGLEAAAKRLQQARVRQEQVVIYGDYDVDGACATALLLEFLSASGLRVNDFIPDRQREGYGLNEKGAAALLELYPETRLVITVDNGIKSHAGSAFLAARGIDLIITDHHLPAETLPSAVAIINPHLCDFPSKNLAGVGVAFYLAWFLQEQWGRSASAASEFLDLVALGTVADLVPLDHNNRILLAYGLRQWQRGKRFGLQALLDIAGVNAEDLRTEDIAFALAPRLNAMGRLRHMRHSVALLCSQNPEEALQRAQACDDCNRERKQLEQEILQHIEIQGKNICWACQPGWHEGVLGVVAAKIKQRQQRPTLIACAAQDENWIKASLRSVPQLSAKAMLDAAAEHIPTEALIYGGHQAAAGFSVRREYFPVLLEHLEEAADFEYEALLEHDGALPTEYFNLQWARYLMQAQPWGSAFPEPVFFNHFRILEQRHLGQNQEHSRLRLQESASGLMCNAVYFFHPPQWQAPAAANFGFRLGINRYLGEETLQLAIQFME